MGKFLKTSSFLNILSVLIPPTPTKEHIEELFINTFKNKTATFFKTLGFDSTLPKKKQGEEYLFSSSFLYRRTKIDIPIFSFQCQVEYMRKIRQIKQ